MKCVVTFSITIGNLNVERSLMNTCTNINIMSLSVGKGIKDVKLKHTRIMIQLADKSIKHPGGVPKEVLVKLGKLLFLMNFMLMDIHEDNEIPLILSRSFMKTAHMTIDIENKQMKI